MESFSFKLRVNPIFEPISPNTPSLNGYFTIRFRYNHLTISSTSNNPKNPIFNYTTPINDNFLIPREVLCNYSRHTIMDSIDNTRFLIDTFHDVPYYVLPEVLHQMGDWARNMVAPNSEGCGMLHMNVLLQIVTRVDMGFSPRLDVETTTSKSTDQCSICLEEFCNGFHKECLIK
ncbi:unnamed protein product [Trifolium pratense]|uniref:Uncharacterized protein n=1 Tax=Trifolium pratense TaxID=57577 RepID=A0ACB0M6E6_TRIPR|nr:unnamed protein product [Trifolium pratense]